MKRVWLWVCGGLVAIIAAGAGLYMTMSAKGAPNQEPRIRVSELSPQEKDRLTLQRVSHSGFAQRAGEIRFTRMEPTPQGWSVAIDAASHEKDLVEICKAAQQLFDHMHQTGVRLADVEAVFRSDAFQDNYGRQLTNLVVATMRFNGQKLQKVKWDNIKPEKLPVIADAFWQNPVLPAKPQPN